MTPPVGRVRCETAGRAQQRHVLINVSDSATPRLQENKGSPMGRDRAFGRWSLGVTGRGVLTDGRRCPKANCL